MCSFPAILVLKVERFQLAFRSPFQFQRSIRLDSVRDFGYISVVDFGSVNEALYTRWADKS